MVRAGSTMLLLPSTTRSTPSEATARARTTTTHDPWTSMYWTQVSVGELAEGFILSKLGGNVLTSDQTINRQLKESFAAKLARLVRQTFDKIDYA